MTGASRGIGLAVAGTLRAAGAHVVRLARSLEDRTGDHQTDFRCDLTDPAAVDRALSRMRSELGVPHVLVNNAGVFFVKPLEATSPEEFGRTLATNLTAAFLVMRALVPAMREQGSGHVVTIGSVADHVAFSGNAAYTASKFGLRGMHAVLAAELAGSGVRATLVSPGPVDTDVWDAIDPDTKPGFTKRAHMLHADDVAEAVLFAVTRAPRVDVTEIRLMPSGYSPRR